MCSGINATYDKYFQHVLTLLWRLENSSSFFYDFDKIAKQYDQLIFNR